MLQTQLGNVEGFFFFFNFKYSAAVIVAFNILGAQYRYASSIDCHYYLWHANLILYFDHKFIQHNVWTRDWGATDVSSTRSDFTGDRTRDFGLVDDIWLHDP